jgi:hypothetical protein
MNISKQIIDSKLYTVILYEKYAYNEDNYRILDNINGSDTLILHDDETLLGTALPALPKHPTKDDKELLHRYISEGLTPVTLCHAVEAHTRKPRQYEQTCIYEEWGEYREITHAIDKDGNKVEIAIENQMIRNCTVKNTNEGFEVTE